MLVSRSPFGLVDGGRRFPWSAKDSDRALPMGGAMKSVGRTGNAPRVEKLPTMGTLPNGADARAGGLPKAGVREGWSAKREFVWEGEVEKSEGKKFEIGCIPDGGANGLCGALRVECWAARLQLSD